ncbi:MAG: DUF1549 and DUF1553 domain-containing protein [Gemmataceae bacterium]
MPASLVCLLTLAAAPAEPVQFRRDVVPALTRAGCNSGTCHGAFQGRGGFRLSLLGFDPSADHDALVREARGRRVFPASPAQSLLLQKATGAIAHGGGKRLHTDSPSYHLIRDWIAQGLAAPSTDDATITRLEVRPTTVTLQPGEQVPLAIRAHWSDGLTRDVTAWALFESNRDRTASAQPDGNFRAHAPGLASIMVRYQGQASAVPVTVPFPGKHVARTWPRHNAIDDHISATWNAVGIAPAPLCDDATFLRRVSLDLIGTLPTVDEVRRFLADRDPAKRDRLIDQLLDRPEYVDHWALRWGDLLRAHRRALGEKGLASFNAWLKSALRENRPFDSVVRELLTARGNLYQQGPAAFYFIDREPHELAESTAQVFLGVRLACARCHHHPFEVWSQDDYHGLAAFFARIRRKDTRDEGLFGGLMSVTLADQGDYTSPVTNRPFAPRVLGGAPLATPPGSDPRQTLATWLTAPENSFFARNIVNRYWAALMGRGLVDPVDDLRASNPASHPALLDHLTREFVHSRYDLKQLLRTLARSRTYQLASKIAPKQDREGVFFAHRTPRRLQAEVLLDAINQVCETPEKFLDLPAGTRALALPDPAVVSALLDTLGRSRRTTNCDCERPTGSDLAQVLLQINSEELHARVTAPTGRIARLLKAKTSDNALVEELYLATLGRFPTSDERRRVAQLLAKAPSRHEGCEDLLWALLNLGEFNCNH